MATRGRGVAGSTWAAPSWVQQGRSGLRRALSRPGRDRGPGSQAGKGGPCGVAGRLGRAGFREGEDSSPHLQKLRTQPPRVERAQPAGSFVREARLVQRRTPARSAAPGQDGKAETSDALQGHTTRPCARAPTSASHRWRVRLALPHQQLDYTPQDSEGHTGPLASCELPLRRANGWGSGGGHGPSEGQEGGEQKGDPGCRGTAGTAPQGRPALGAPVLRITAGQPAGRGRSLQPQLEGVRNRAQEEETESPEPQQGQESPPGW